MKIRHREGKVVLKFEHGVPTELEVGDRVDKLSQSIILTEDEAKMLLNKEGQSYLEQAINEARQYNAKAKRDKIDQLKAELRKLEESL